MPAIIEEARDRSMEKERIKGWLHEVDSIAQEMADGKAEALSSLIGKLLGEQQDYQPGEYGAIEFGLPDLANRVSKQSLGALYAAAVFCQDLRENIGSDSRGFPREAGFPVVQEMAKSLGEFVQAGLTPSSQEGSLAKFGDAVKQYNRLIEIGDEEVKTRGFDPDSWVKIG